VLGTRPEAIKLAPVIFELKRHPKVISRVCVTAQHREMLDPFLRLFNIDPDYDLNIMQPNQTLFDITARALYGLKDVLESERPDIVLVQGDTTTAFAAALATFYLKIPIGHVEAGLRTSDKYQPFPEEINRRLISHLADLHFAPTERAKANLLAEGIPPARIHVTGNTVIDALLFILERTRDQDVLPPELARLPPDRKIILVTAHRRENFGKGLENICIALRRIVQEAPEVEIVYPVHLNLNVRAVALRLLAGIERVRLLDPLDYVAFVHLMARSYFILTDSGGIQEEAPTLKKPVLVLRDTTERPEVLEVGAAKLVGTNPNKIVSETLNLLRNPREYDRMANAGNPFGDGQAAIRIVKSLLYLDREYGNPDRIDQ
ncbi:MAG: UDP-N-acetylglucosamine 2-epimerase (non-hydrolyzing), partial [Candidatus Bipolaricaulaceae bacterium]